MDDIQDLESLSVEQLIEIIREKTGAKVNLSFPGKAVARTVARKVRPRVQRTLKTYSAGDAEGMARNLVIEGDNLQALSSLYKERGQVDLILTDPPYNTGKDFRYNDKWDRNPNDPELGSLVEEKDPARHTKWMRFMYPRLQVMRDMLKPTGVLAICIDYRELFHLGQMLDELFGESNRLAIISWEKTAAPRSDAGHVTSATEYVLVYAKNEEIAVTQRLDRKASSDRRYGNPDNDPDGLWREANLTARTHDDKNDYAIQSPFTGEFHYPAGSGAWRHPKANVKKWLEQWGAEYTTKNLGDGKVPALVVKGSQGAKLPDGTREAAQAVLSEGPYPFVWFGMKGDGRPRVKTHLQKVKKGAVPTTYWSDDDEPPLNIGSTSWNHEESGRSSDGLEELNALVGPGHGFGNSEADAADAEAHPDLVSPNGTVLDPFAGSGTTGHAVLSLNAAQGADRRFILIEQGRPENGDSYARTLTTDRLRRVVEGDWANGTGVPLGSGFTFKTLTKQVDGKALLLMEREEMVDTVIASHTGSSRRRGNHITPIVNPEDYRYLVAINGDNEGLYLIWGGADKNTDLTEEVYEDCVEEGDKAGLAKTYHVYSRLNLFVTDDVKWYQIPDRILQDFGLDVKTESFTDED